MKMICDYRHGCIGPTLQRIQCTSIYNVGGYTSCSSIFENLTPDFHNDNIRVYPTPSGWEDLGGRVTDVIIFFERLENSDSLYRLVNFL